MEWTLGLDFYGDNIMLLNPFDLTKKKTKDLIKAKGFHVYLVCKRKKFHFASSELDGKNNVTTLYYLDEKHEKRYVKFTHVSSLVVSGFADGYYNIVVDGIEGTLRDFEMVSLLTWYNTDIAKTSGSLPSDLEVMYIGQAFGRKTKKTVEYRLVKHEKVQQIALEIIDKGSSEEVLAIAVRIKTNDVATSVVRAGSNTVRPTVDSLLKVAKKARMRVPDGQEITIFEASLIRYFQPEYNKEYKETFPSKDYPSYEDIYKTEFAYTAVSLNLEDIKTRLFSKHISTPSLIHSERFLLSSPQDKRSLFQYLYDFSDR